MIRAVKSIVAAALALVCACACASAWAARTPAPVVPFLPLKPAKPAVRVVPTAPPCRAAQLRVADRGFVFQPASGGAVGGVDLQNVSRSACSLVGVPRVRFDWPRSKPPRQVQYVLRPLPRSAFDSFRPGSWIRSLDRGHSAFLPLAWFNWCGPGARGGGSSGALPARLRVILGHGRGSIAFPFNGVGACYVLKAPSRIGVGAFQPPAAPAPPPWTRIPLAVSVVAPLSSGSKAQRQLVAARGTTLRYRIRIVNRSRRRTLRFGTCPLYSESIAPYVATRVYRLNCTGLAPLRPGQSRVYAMELPVPRKAPLGPDGLFWALDPSSNSGPTTDARLIVTPRRRSISHEVLALCALRRRTGLQEDTSSKYVRQAPSTERE